MSRGRRAHGGNKDNPKRYAGGRSAEAWGGAGLKETEVNSASCWKSSSGMRNEQVLSCGIQGCERWRGNMRVMEVRVQWAEERMAGTVDSLLCKGFVCERQGERRQELERETGPRYFYRLKEVATPS